MSYDNLQERMRNSLKAEEKRVQERFASSDVLSGAGTVGDADQPAEKPSGDQTVAGASAGPVSRDSASGSPVTSEPFKDESTSYDPHMAEIKSRYLRIGFDPTPDEVLRTGLLALDQLPGSELRKLIQSIPGVRKS